MSEELVEGFKRSHSRMAMNFNTYLKFNTDIYFPKKIWIQKLNLKRVTNGLISNAIKHTHNGRVVINIGIECLEVGIFNNRFGTVGSKPVDGHQ